MQPEIRAILTSKPRVVHIHLDIRATRGSRGPAPRERCRFFSFGDAMFIQ